MNSAYRGGMASFRQQATTRTLREADDQTVEELVASLPPERQAIVARAAIRSAPRQVAADPQIRHAMAPLSNWCPNANQNTVDLGGNACSGRPGKRPANADEMLVSGEA